MTITAINHNNLSEEQASFSQYVASFYATDFHSTIFADDADDVAIYPLFNKDGGLSTQLIFDNTAKFMTWANAKGYAWGGGDSLDRERYGREYLLAEFGFDEN